MLRGHRRASPASTCSGSTGRLCRSADGAPGHPCSTSSPDTPSLSPQAGMRTRRRSSRSFGRLPSRACSQRFSASQQDLPPAVSSLPSAALSSRPIPRLPPGCDPAQAPDPSRSHPPPLRKLLKLLRENRRGLSQVATLLGNHPNPDEPFSSTEEGVETYRRFFDLAVRRDEPSSVAAHSLGDDKLLEKATQEIIELFDRLGVLGPHYRVLEIGCGLGRIVAAVAPRVSEIFGIDISPAMIQVARQRTAGLGNVALSVTSGRDLAQFPSESFDFVYGADTFPYIYHAGPDLAALHVREAARLLRSGGHLVILNYSYRDDVKEDRREGARRCASGGLELLVEGRQPLKLWDAVLFHARKLG